jgi:hypothetical protein
MASREEELQELTELEELERLEAEERALLSPVDTKKAIQPANWRTGEPSREIDVDVNPVQALREGIGSGLVRAVRGTVNVGTKLANLSPQARLQKALTGTDRFETPEFASDEALTEQDKLDAPLSKSDMGGLGQMVGQGAAALPMGGAPRAATAAQGASNVLTRTLASPVTRSAVEGSISGATTAAPEDQVRNAVLGGGLGAGLTKVGQALKRTVSGLGRTGDPADHLEQFAEQHGKDVFIPASQAISDESDIPSRLVKTLYKEVLPLIPGASGQFKAQGKRLTDDVREIALREADFKGVLTPDDIADPQQAIVKLQKAIDDEYADTVKAYSFRIPLTFRDGVKTKIQAALPDVDDVTLNKIATSLDEKVNRYASNRQSIVGENLLNAKNAMSDEIRGLKGAEKKAGVAAMQAIEDLIEQRLTMGGSPVMRADLARYKAMSEPYAAFMAVKEAVKKASVKGGEFTPAQLVRSAKRSPVQQMLGQTAHEVTDQSLGTPSAAGRVTAYGALGALGGLGSPLAAAGVVGGGNLLATELAQDILMGRSGAQQALVDALRRNPKKLQYAGTAGRAGATSNREED